MKNTVGTDEGRATKDATEAGRAMKARDAAIAGALAGFAGGAAFAGTLTIQGQLATVASIVHTDNVVAGLAVHMVIATILGVGFGLLISRQRARAGETVFWGLIYGAFWWFLGPQTLLPLFLGKPVAWDLGSAQALLPSLMGHLLYGAVAGIAFVVLQQDTDPLWRNPSRGMVLRGLIAGLAVGLVLGLPWEGLLAGAGYALIASPESTGPALVRGTVYGFAWWVFAALTVEPLLFTVTLDWSQQAAARDAHLMPAYVLLGAGIAVGYTWLGLIAKVLFTDDIRLVRTEAAGKRGLRALGYGALSGLAGGLVFTVVMVAVGEFPLVAQMIGSHSAVAGFVVHMVIAQILGISYAILFRRRSFDLTSGIGWGLSYGFFWWTLGNLTLLPLFTGAPVDWSAAGIAAGFPSLVGHLAYGAALGAVYHRLERRANPWWQTRSKVVAEQTVARRDQIRGAAPAMWVFTVLIALIIPILVGTAP
ncbi:MAG TPA: hypothetical protein VL652_05055 [Kutzneria sp.]|nr:hypothetical protein [Kutzneria sp.]